MTWIKICGLRRPEDAEAVAAAGADAAGLVFHPPSPRYVDVETAAAIARRLPRSIARAGVFVNAADEVMEAARVHIGLDSVQLHGNEAAARRPRIGCSVIRVARTAEEARRLRETHGAGATILVDANAPGFFGGSGRAADDSTVAEARHCARWILSGGLDAENVVSRLHAFAPWGVDVSSGVEATPGMKDAAKILAFVAAVRAAGAVAAGA